ncbi:MAG: protein kinase [Victivallales bacterium]|nr:protein kinase [Victivallales bacterium]
MAQAVCKGCGGVMDTTGIEPFTVCECSDCGTEVIIPFELDYLLLEKLVERQSAIDVYSGFDKAANSDVYIMLVDNQVPDHEKYEKMAKEEAVSLSTLKHPNICPLLHYDTIKGNFCVTFPLMDGYQLDSYSPSEQGMLDVDSVVEVLQAAALGLAIAHHKEFVHHNICPASIHIDARGNVRVKNFYISRMTYMIDQLELKEDAAIKFDSSVSPYFISPEKAESGVEDKRGDVFSFGVVMYFMLTGQYPFSGGSEIETVYARVMKKKKDKSEVFSGSSGRLLTPEMVEYVPPKPPVQLRPDIPGEISDLTMDMLSYLPVKRPKFSEILSIFNLYKAKKDKEQSVVTAQKNMVATKTRAIPKMTPLDGKGKSKPKKWSF